MYSQEVLKLTNEGIGAAFLSDTSSPTFSLNSIAQILQQTFLLLQALNIIPTNSHMSTQSDFLTALLAIKNKYTMHLVIIVVITTIVFLCSNKYAITNNKI